MNPQHSALLTDLYQLTMLQGYFEQGMDETAVFEFFVRKLPEKRGFLIAAGLEQRRAIGALPGHGPRDDLLMPPSTSARDSPSNWSPPNRW